VLGERVSTFESGFAAFTGVTHCVGTGNGHDALVLSLRATGLGRGDEVIVPANTYIATWLAVTNAGCTIIPVEPDVRTCNIDVQQIEAHITPRTRAILPVHLYGSPCDMDAIGSIAARYSLTIIEDNAQGHGAIWKGRRTGSFGKVNATSFYPTKNLGALGDGGAVTTSDDAIAARVRRLRNYGFSSKDVCGEVGINSRLDELQAAVLSIKLKRLGEWNARRRAIARRYDEGLAGVGDLVLPYAAPGAEHVYHLYVIRSGLRDGLKGYLEAKGIGTMVHYPIPPHLQGAYAWMGYHGGMFPITEAMADQLLSLPVWPGMSEGQVERVVEAVRGFFGG
jgi:dTDP-4-amino-4,6-dideoxygalactose transaminase